VVVRTNAAFHGGLRKGETMQSPCPDPWLQLDGACQRVRGTMVLDRLDLSVAQGSFVTVLGAPRSGKTALIDLLAGFTRPEAGRVQLGGADLRGVSPRRRGFGVVMQADVLFPHLSLAHNIEFPLRFRKIPRAARRRMVETALDLVQLDDAGRKPDQVSHAERQRAALARAALAGTRLLLLDEPLAAQDYAARPQMAAMLRRLHNVLGATIVMTTTSNADALALSDQIAVLAGGRIAQSGTPAAIYTAPASPAIAALTGEVSLLRGHVVELADDEARVRLTCGVSVEGRAMQGLRVRDPCTLAIRPEQIAVAPVAAEEMGPNALDATVVETLHLGDQLRLRLLIGAGAELLVKRPAAAGLRGLAPGETVAVAWQPAHAVILAGSDG
jgi:putative spermidine/putrescine transport system ATP-binding protein